MLHVLHIITRTHPTPLHTHTLYSFSLSPTPIICTLLTLPTSWHTRLLAVHVLCHQHQQAAETDSQPCSRYGCADRMGQAACEARCIHASSRRIRKGIKPQTTQTNISAQEAMLPPTSQLGQLHSWSMHTMQLRVYQSWIRTRTAIAVCTVDAMLHQR